jgi:hypothetical protein
LYLLRSVDVGLFQKNAEEQLPMMERAALANEA